MTLQDLLKTNDLFTIIESPLMEGECKDDYKRVKNRLKMYLQQMEIDAEKYAYSYRHTIHFRSVAARYPNDADVIYPQHKHIINKITAFETLLLLQRRKKNLSFIKLFFRCCVEIFEAGIAVLSMVFSDTLSILLLARFVAKLLNYLPLERSPLRLPWVPSMIDYSSLEVNVNLFSGIAFLFDWVYRVVGAVLGGLLGVIAGCGLAPLAAFLVAGYFYIIEKKDIQQAIARDREAFLNIPEDTDPKDFPLALLMGLHVTNKNSYGIGSVFSSSAIADPQPLKLVFEFLGGAAASPTPVPVPALEEEDAHESKGKSPAPRSASDGELLQTQGIFPHPQPSGQPPPRIAGLDEDEVIPTPMDLNEAKLSLS